MGSERKIVALNSSNTILVSAYIGETFKRKELNILYERPFMAIPREDLIIKIILFASLLSGFLDGDGSINAQIVKRHDYKLRFQIRVSISFYQKTVRHDFILWLHIIIKVGIIRKRIDGISEYTITGIKNVRPFLMEIYPYLRIKKDQADLLIYIMNEMEKELNSYSFLELCKKVDLFKDLNDSKKRTINYEIVKSTFDTLFPRRD